MGEWLGWHFLPEDRRLRYGDGREVVVGETLSCDGPLSLCENGMHASRRAIDALGYAPGPIACWVRLSGAVLSPDGEDKVCATERTVLAMADAKRAIQEWAIWCAEQALPIFEKEHPGDRRPRIALDAKQKWLAGEISDSELDAAKAAAWDASWDAARSAARAAAWEAAMAAAWAAARATSWDAAGDAARSAARAAANAAASAAARAAASAATVDVQNAELERRLCALLRLDGEAE